MQPVHTRDLLSADDTDFQSAMAAASDDIEGGGHNSTTGEDDVAGTAFNGDTKERSVSVHSLSHFNARNPQAHSLDISMPSPSASVGRRSWSS